MSKRDSRKRCTSREMRIVGGDLSLKTKKTKRNGALKEQKEGTSDKGKVRREGGDKEGGTHKKTRRP